ncbi:hypothetical protein IVB30_13035 [Bradyrhizobium sp. 200]|nr:hypothetical protein IVB30_13035 [Bradyrhizobium sp. 200]
MNQVLSGQIQRLARRPYSIACRRDFLKQNNRPGEISERSIKALTRRLNLPNGRRTGFLPGALICAPIRDPIGDDGNGNPDGAPRMG